ncbi:MAG: amidase, partial [Bacteroidota bacterium]
MKRPLHLLCCAAIILLTACTTSTPELGTTSNTSDIDLEEITIADIQAAFAKKEYTIEQLTQAYLDRIEAIDQNGPTLNSIIQINPDALTMARTLDAELAAGNSRGPMHGIPVVLKDNIDTDDQMFTTAGANILKNSKPQQDAYIVEKLRAAGAVILAKANLSEWANFHSSYSSSGWSAVGGQTKNPYELSRNPCGSSAGSGVSVSANLTVIAIGTETNGSIVCPSNNNGIVGIKPTVGLLSRSGIIPISFTQDTPGPMARTVRDAAICLGVMTGTDPADSKTAASEGNAHTDYTSFLSENALQGKRIGYFKSGVDRYWRIEKVINAAIEELEKQGATIVEIDAVTADNIGASSYQVLLYEFKDGLNQYFTALGDQAPVKDMDELVERTLKDPDEMKYFDHQRMIDANEKGSLKDEAYKEALETMLKGSRENGIDKVMKENNLDAIISPTGGPAWKI